MRWKSVETFLPSFFSVGRPRAIADLMDPFFFNLDRRYKSFDIDILLMSASIHAKEIPRGLCTRKNQLSRLRDMKKGIVCLSRKWENECDHVFGWAEPATDWDRGPHDDNAPNLVAQSENFLHKIPICSDEKSLSRGKRFFFPSLSLSYSPQALSLSEPRNTTPHFNFKLVSRRGRTETESGNIEFLSGHPVLNIPRNM